VSNPTAIQTYTPDGDEFSLGLDPKKDLRLEFVQLNGQIGKFTYGRNRLEGVSSIRLVLLLKLPESRALFRKGVLGDPLCSSDNNVIPVNLEQAKALEAGPTCAACKYGQWYGKQKPPCSENVNMLAASHPESGNGDPFPFILRVRGTSVPVMQALFTALERTRNGELLPNGAPMPPFAYFILLESEHVTKAGTGENDPGQNFYRLKAKIDGKSDQAQWTKYASLYHMYHERAAQLLNVSSETERAASVEEQQHQGPIPQQMATPPQVKFISDLLAELGLDDGAVPNLTNGTDISSLTRQQASAVIEQLKAQQTRQRAQAAAAVPVTPVGAPDILPFDDADNEANLASLAATEPADDYPDNDTIETTATTLPSTAVPAATDDAEWEPPIFNAPEPPATSASTVIDATVAASIRQIAKDQYIADPDLAKWIRALYSVEEVEALRPDQAASFIEKLNKRADTVRARAQAPAPQQHAAGTPAVTTAPAPTRGRPKK
jgi:hypothetical protein